MNTQEQEVAFIMPGFGDCRGISPWMSKLKLQLHTISRWRDARKKMALNIVPLSWWPVTIKMFSPWKFETSWMIPVGCFEKGCSIKCPRDARMIPEKCRRSTCCGHSSYLYTIEDDWGASYPTVIISVCVKRIPRKTHGSYVAYCSIFVAIFRQACMKMCELPQFSWSRPSQLGWWNPNDW